MSSYTIVGVDFSLTSPGVSALLVYDDLSYKFIDWDCVKTSANEEWFIRQKRISDMVVGFILRHNPQLVMIENYSYGSRNGRELAGEVHGVSIFRLLEQGFPPERVRRIVAPKSRARFLTGNGRATKGEVVKAVNQTFNLNFKVKENDIADACVLAFIGYCMNHYQQLEHFLTKHQREIITKLLKSNQSF